MVQFVRPSFAVALVCLSARTVPAADLPRDVSGVYPSLAMFNDEGECGTGAMAPFAGRLWVVTYGPHKPFGSSDKLYEITSDLQQIVRPESVGGTNANRLIHRESQQLAIGLHLIDAQGQVRTIAPKQMPGRLTGNARHLTDPTNKIYFATMEEGLYEVDVHTLAVTGLLKDKNAPKPGQTEQTHPAEITSKLPGYHGKGLFTGQHRLIYAQNGEQGPKALVDPTIASGALAQWQGSGDWQLVRRNQFTEVTGPGSIAGNLRDDDPVWSIGWDHRSLILALCDAGQWSFFRLPKASHSYDGAHGWHTEWPRIRDVGATDKPDWLMTMHGLFWKFPATFSRKNTAGIAPRSAFLKITGDFCRWSDRVAFGCDDTAKDEFTNKRKIKQGQAGPGQSQSNLWFVDPKQLDRFGPTTADGAVWLNDAVQEGEISTPFLFAGWPLRSGFFVNRGEHAISFALEVDRRGNGQWTKLRDVEVPAGQSTWSEFPADEAGQWIRVTASAACSSATVQFNFVDPDRRETKSSPIFDGLARIDDQRYLAGLAWPRGENKRTLALAAVDVRDGQTHDVGYYELDGDLKLRRVEDEKTRAAVQKTLAIPRHVLTVEASSVLVVDDRGRRWRMPKGNAAFDQLLNDGLQRLAREVATERDVFNCHGTIYELPAETADGFAHIRPIASHNLALMDFCSFRGLMILTGVAAKSNVQNSHLVRSDDGKAAVWAGAIDDLWQLGKPTGAGGPWKDTQVQAGVPSDPYLLGFYDRRHLQLSHQGNAAVRMTVEVDPTGHGPWVKYREFNVEPGESVEHDFSTAFSARWLRVTADKPTRATAWLTYR